MVWNFINRLPARLRPTPTNRHEARGIRDARGAVVESAAIRGWMAEGKGVGAFEEGKVIGNLDEPVPRSIQTVRVALAAQAMRWEVARGRALCLATTRSGQGDEKPADES